jgi:hypothetical protein
MQRTQAIKAFLEIKSHSDLAALYNHDMECQVNVAQDDGERIEGEYLGRIWHGWTDGPSTWKSFRIPYKASSEPEYNDVSMSFPLSKHAEGIGMTGWDWKAKVSKWVAFDFDAITGHSDKHNKKLDPIQMNAVKEMAHEIPWVTVRRSTSGSGLHLYVFLDDVPTANHTEHAALARAILGTMSAMTGFDFNSKVDICGGNMWVWHRKMEGTDGLQILKSGDTLKEVPSNWRDHLNVIKRKVRRTAPGFIDSTDETFEELSGKKTQVPLDADHKRLIAWLTDNAYWWWDQDHHMLVCHTYDLKLAHEALSFDGIFDTLAEGTERGSDQNCFCFPLRKGGWVVRRHTRGVQEADTWDQDGGGWTRCYYHKEPDLRTAARSHGGIESQDGSFVFREGESAMGAASKLGTFFELPTFALGRKTKLKRHKDGRLMAEMDHDANDLADKMPGWLVEKGKWRRIFSTQLADPAEPDIGNYDDVVRHVITELREDNGWCLQVSGEWTKEPLPHVKAALKSIGMTPKEVEILVGSCVSRPWTNVSRPFQPEYPGNRQWNRSAAQLAYPLLTDEEHLTFPTWEKVLTHIGTNLDPYIKTHSWCKSNGIQTGYDYLKCWVASLIQYPLEPLPYLFLYGPQNSGKSILHESLSLLFTTGVARADHALTTNFNAELEGQVLCVIEETNLGSAKGTAYNRIKDWVTSPDLSIHKKGMTPYKYANTSHWIQCANEQEACPIFPDDTRITMIFVDEIEEMIAKRVLMSKLEREASHFLTSVSKLELPEVVDRLNIPIIETDDKRSAADLNKTALLHFIEQDCHYAPGKYVKIADFVKAFHRELPMSQAKDWGKIKVGKSMPTKFPKGRIWDGAANDWCYGNISLTPVLETPTHQYVKEDDKIVLEEL